MPNQLTVKMIQEVNKLLDAEETDVSIFYHLRQHCDYTGNKNDVVQYCANRREQLESAERAGVLVLNHLRLEDSTSALLSDCYDQLAQCDTTDPREIRELMQKRSELANASDKRHSKIVEMALEGAVDLLEQTPSGAGDLRSRFEELFPPQVDDD